MSHTIPGEALSPSQASMYLGCSARWYFRYMRGLPDPASGGAVRGSAVHSLVAYALTAKMEGEDLESAAFEDAWDHAWDEAAEVAQFDAYDDIDQLKRSGAVLARKYCTEVVPDLEPAGVEVPFAGEIAGVAVRGRVDIVERSGRVIDLKTSSRKSSKISADHAFQLATYAALLPDASGETRLDMLVSTKDPQLVQIEHTPDAGSLQLIERLYPLVAEGIAGGLFLPNRASTLCSRRYCAFADECEAEFGGQVD